MNKSSRDGGLKIFSFLLLLVSGSVWQFLSVSPGLAGLRSSNTEDGNGCHGGHCGADALGAWDGGGSLVPVG